MSDHLSWMPWRRDRRDAEAARRRDLRAIAAECERLAEGADDEPTRLAYQRAAEAAGGLTSAPPIAEGGAPLVWSLLPAEEALADEQSSVRALLQELSDGRSGGDTAVIGAAVITGIAAVAVASIVGWTFGRATFALGAAIAAVVFGGTRRGRSRRG